MDAAEVDLVLVGVRGVQQFIVESRTTLDVANSSLIVQRLIGAAAELVADRLTGQVEPIGLIYPAGGDQEGVTSRISFLAAAGDGPAVAADAVRAVTDEWRDMVERGLGKEVATPGMPDLWWVCATGSAATDEQFRRLRDQVRELAEARGRCRVFDPLSVEKVWLCTQSPRLPSVEVPHGVRAHERRERLSAAGWVKRRHQREPGAKATRSTLSIASTPFRVGLLRSQPDGLARQVGALLAAANEVSPDLPDEQSVRGGVSQGLRPLAEKLGAWVHPEVWNVASLRREYGSGVAGDVVDAGLAAATEIVKLARSAGIRRPTPYYAILVQDLDRLGEAMGLLNLAGQREASRQLVELGRAQREVLAGADFPAVPVYAGGDDLLAFCPAANAVTLAGKVRRLVDAHLAEGPLSGAAGGPVTATTAVVFVHVTSPLQTALAAARQADEEAKDALSAQGTNRDALTVVVLRRGGERARTIQPWSGDPVALLEQLRPSPAALSGGLASQLERDEGVLAQLAGERRLLPTLRAEVTRLVMRRGGTGKEATALHELAWRERACQERARPAGEQPGQVGYRPVSPLLVARFLAQECAVTQS